MLINFDASVLGNPEFGEDAVREELITPLLHCLGYSASGTNRIIRSRRLEHPFVHIGTRSERISIIPDYALYAGDVCKFILDAKAPRQNIRNGKNVEQAFSYAIHPDIRSSLYALCNGYSLIVFSISKREPELEVKMSEIRGQWESIERLLGPAGHMLEESNNFKPDLGLYWLKAGLDSKIRQYFYGVGLPSISKVNDSLFSVFVNIQIEGEWYAVSFDFDRIRYQQLLRAVKPEVATVIHDCLSRQPYTVDLGWSAPVVDIEAVLGKRPIKAEKEQYVPFEVRKFGPVKE
jgi:hypothetical protein